MHHEQARLIKMSCPACGFQVFNRRYPKCERCGSGLPASLLYSDQERQALLEAEKEQLSLELRRRQRDRSREAIRRRRISTTPGIPVEASRPGSDGAAVYDGSAASISNTFTSGGGGAFDGGGASGSFGGDSGSSSSDD